MDKDGQVMQTINLLPWRERDARYRVYKSITYSMIFIMFLLALGALKYYELAFENAKLVKKEQSLALRFERLEEKQRQLRKLDAEIESLKSKRIFHLLPKLRQAQSLLRLQYLIQYWPQAINFVDASITHEKIEIHVIAPNKTITTKLLSMMRKLPGYIQIERIDFKPYTVAAAPQMETNTSRVLVSIVAKYHKI